MKKSTLKLEAITPHTIVRGVLPSEDIEVVAMNPAGPGSFDCVYRDSRGQLGSKLLDASDEGRLEIVRKAGSWDFSAPAKPFKIASEAHRIRLAHLFDPLTAVHTSNVEPLPHQILAVYVDMLKKQPLRYLLADDPGAGKTIMSGLFIKELLIRGDVQRCLVVSPGNLTEQWQDELRDKFHLHFDLLTRDKLESSRTGNWFNENSLVIARLDQLSRDEMVQDQLLQSEWDLIICDEAHKMSASWYGNEFKQTQRYKLGRKLATHTRHFLLLTATPHNGKDDDFHAFMALLDPDRFEGRVRNDEKIDVSDLMRRMVKENLVTFEGKPLFPERRAYTVTYKLSALEADLYEKVTSYVREEFNKADNLHSDKRKGTVGFALTVLQRRLASSPAAICRSLERRLDRLKKRLVEARNAKVDSIEDLEAKEKFKYLSTEDVEDFDDSPDSEVEEQEEFFLDQATAAQTVKELQAEITILEELVRSAQHLRRQKTDTKWSKLKETISDNHEMFLGGRRRKLVIFTEHRDTLAYLYEELAAHLGRRDALTIIHGGLNRQQRKVAEQEFKNNKDCLILLATDAAGEGINLQCAHLMVNYDLPWNPNRLEQRFGRIHRIGQKDVCHLWNLVAEETREGEVYKRLLDKLATEREALGDVVFDILGQVFEGSSLRHLLLEAIRYGDQPEVKARLEQTLSEKLDRKQIEKILEEEALAHETLDQSKLQAIKDQMERAEAKKLQPHFVASFFSEALDSLGGQMREREKSRFEIPRVPVAIREKFRADLSVKPIASTYNRVTFDRHLINDPSDEYICPGHPLLDAVVELAWEKFSPYLKQGTILIDPDDYTEDLRALFYVEQAIRDGRRDRSGSNRVISKQLHFVEIYKTGRLRSAGYAPYLDYEGIREADRAYINPLLSEDWLKQPLDRKAISFATSEIFPKHFEDVQRVREEMVEKTKLAVRQRLHAEMVFWDNKANELKEKELEGRATGKMNSARARKRADELGERLERRMQQLEQERQLNKDSPAVVGGALVVPQGLLMKLRGETFPEPIASVEARQRIERVAMDTVMQLEREKGHEPRDVSLENLGWDIESRNGRTGVLRFIEVKGRHFEAPTVTVTRNEILAGLNKRQNFVLALVKIRNEDVEARYVVSPFEREPDVGAASINYSLKDLWERGVHPHEEETH